MEAIYENALMIEMHKCGLEAKRQVEISVMYDNIEVGKHRLDIVVEDQIIVELKAVRTLEEIFYSTVRSYLRATSKKRALLLNFGKTTLEIKRIYP